MQRNTALFEGLAAGHFGAAHAARDLDLHAFGAHAHRRSDGGLHGAAVRDTAFELAGDVVADDHGVQFGTFYLEDIDLNLLAGEFAQLFLQLVDLLAAFADDDAGTGRRDGDGHQFQRTLDDDLRDACFGQTGAQVFTNLGVFDQLARKILAAVPVGIPTAYDTESVCYRINFLSHLLCFFYLL